MEPPDLTLESLENTVPAVGIEKNRGRTPRKDGVEVDVNTMVNNVGFKTAPMVRRTLRTFSLEHRNGVLL
jgi:hypothetical protein